MPFVTGGMQQHTYYLAKYLTLCNCQVNLVHCVYNGEIPQHSDINFSLFGDNNKLYKIITLKFPVSFKFPGHYIYNSWRYSKLIYELVKEEIDSFDFIYMKGFSGWQLLRMQSKAMNNPPIGINFHGMNMFLPTNGFKLILSNLLFRPFVKFNMKKSDYVFSYGGKVTSTIISAGVPREKIIEIPTGIERRLIINEDSVLVNKKLKFLFIGRDDPLKGIDEIFKALKSIKPSCLDFQFIGPITKKLVRSNIKYHGLIKSRKNVINIMDQCDVLILPSYSEGMPNVILEAMSRGLIIIASNVGAVNILVSSKNGILIENPKHKNILFAMKTLLKTDTETLIKMKKFSINIAKSSFTWEKVINHTTKIISSKLKK
jgi:glycosyltransferase involved in cell wall biosynthesis